MSSPAGSTANFRPEIHALRALAVVLVVLYHVRLPGVGGGFVGVDVFFVISGFLITGSLVEESLSTSGISLPMFYARRMRRLLPAATAVTIATLFASRLLLSPLAQVELVRSSISSSTYVSNLVFAYRSLDYLAGDVRNDPFLHTWSLGVEEQFYLVWPVLILLSTRLAGPASSVRSRRGGITVAMALVAVASFFACFLLMGKSQPWAFFGSPARAWEFGLGGIARLLERRLARRGVLAKVLAATGTCSILVAATRYSESTVFPGLAAVPPALGAALVACSGQGLGTARRPLDNKAVRWIGEHSYSWYLWHWPVLVIPEIAFGPLDLRARIILGVISLVLAWGTYRWIENPFRFNRGLARSPTRSILLGFGLSALSVAAALALHFGAKHALSVSPQDKIWIARTSIPRVYADGCHLTFQGQDAGPCVYGDPNGDSTVMLYGDSHAASWFPVVDSICRTRRYRLLSLTKSACPPALFLPWAQVFHRPYRECEEWHKSVLAKIRTERPFLVIVSSAQVYQSDSLGRLDTLEWGRGWKNLLDTLSAAGASIVVIQDVPRSPRDLPSCLSAALWRDKPESTCDFGIPSDEDGLRRRIEDMAGPGVRVLDLTSLFCRGGTCRASSRGYPIYSDAQHISIPFSLGLLPDLDSEVFGKP